MRVRFEKPWQPLDEPQVADLPGQLGVYEIADEHETVLAVGFAGGHAPFGLRSKIQFEKERWEGRARWFRVEVNQQYLSRYEELLAAHLADHGELPEGNLHERERRIGRLEARRSAPPPTSEDRDGI